MTRDLGICIWCIPASTPEEQLNLAASSGLRGIELEVGSYEDGFAFAPDGYREWRDRWDLTYPSIGINALCRYGMSKPAQRKTVEQGLDAVVSAAAALDIPLIQLPSFVDGWIETAEDFDSTVDCLKYVCQRAADHGIFVGTENALSASEQLRLLEKVGCGNLRIYFDTANPWEMADMEAAPILEAVYPHLSEIHLKDGNGKDGPALLGEGMTNVSDSVDVLKAHDYSGWLIVETAYSRIAETTGKPAESLIQQDIETIRGLLA